MNKNVKLYIRLFVYCSLGESRYLSSCLCRHRPRIPRYWKPPACSLSWHRQTSLSTRACSSWSNTWQTCCDISPVRRETQETTINYGEMSRFHTSRIFQGVSGHPPQGLRCIKLLPEFFYGKNSGNSGNFFFPFAICIKICQSFSMAKKKSGK